MNIKVGLVLVLFLVAGVSGFYLGQGRAGDEDLIILEKVTEQRDKTNKINFRDLSSDLKTPVKVSKKESLPIKETYLVEFLSEENKKELYNKTLRIFPKAKYNKSLALWVTLGTEFTNEKEYAALYHNSLDKLNENPEETLRDISGKIQTLEKKDDFLRGMLNNLVHNLEVEEEQKMEFFGTELNRPIELDEYGGLAEGSTSLLTSLIMLRQYVKNDEDVREYLGQSMKKNESEKLKGTLREKYLTYFPSLGDEI